MAVPKILLYYCFTPLADPDAIRLWQYELCSRLGLKGRIIVSPHGINGTVGGDVHACKLYVKATRDYQPFHEIDVKWSEGTGDDFPRLSVKSRDEIVTFGHPDELKVDAHGVVGGGTHLTPTEVNRLVADRGDEVAFFDGRNAWEARIGRFKGAVVPDTETTADFVAELESGKYDHLKNRPVVTYCTGGVRCEVLSSLMINRGFSEVYQLDGGIVRYGQSYGDTALWEGSLAVFDGRRKVTFTRHAKQIGLCDRCGNPADDFRDCTEATCKGRALLCDECGAAEGPVLCERHATAR